MRTLAPPTAVGLKESELFGIPTRYLIIGGGVVGLWLMFGRK
jgi:hypothetical protein